MTDELEAGLQDPGGGGGGGSQGGEAPEWMGVLPEDLQGNESLAKFKQGEGEELVPMPASLAKSYVSLETKIGANPLVVPANDAPEEQWDEFFGKIGRPGTPAEYELPVPEGFPEDYLDPEMEENFRGTAHKLGLTGAQAKGLNDWVNGFVAEEVAARQKADEEAKAGFVTYLRKEYAGDAEKMRVKGLQAAKLYGGDELFKELEDKGLTHNVPIMRAFISMANATSETALKGTDIGDAPGKKLSREQLEEQMKDPRYTGQRPDGRDMAFVKMVTEGFQNLYPEKTPGAPMGPGEGA